LPPTVVVVVDSVVVDVDGCVVVDVDGSVVVVDSVVVDVDGSVVDVEVEVLVLVEVEVEVLVDVEVDVLVLVEVDVLVLVEVVVVEQFVGRFSQPVSRELPGLAPLPQLACACTLTLTCAGSGLESWKLSVKRNPLAALNWCSGSCGSCTQAPPGTLYQTPMLGFVREAGGPPFHAVAV
jgi:hypothetical protein